MTNQNPNQQSRNPNDPSRAKASDPHGDTSARKASGDVGGEAQQDSSFGAGQGTQDRSSRGRESGGRSSGSEQAIECLASAIEVVIRELPRGPSARLEGAQEQLRKARQQLGAASESNESGWRPSDSSSSSSRGSRQGPNRDDGGMRLSGSSDGESIDAPGRDRR